MTFGGSESLRHLTLSDRLLTSVLQRLIVLAHILDSRC